MGHVLPSSSKHGQTVNVRYIANALLPYHTKKTAMSDEVNRSEALIVAPSRDEAQHTNVCINCHVCKSAFWKPVTFLIEEQERTSHDMLAFMVTSCHKSFWEEKRGRKKKKKLCVVPAGSVLSNSQCSLCCHNTSCV